MKLALPFHEVTQSDRSRVGGKGFALAAMQKSGMQIPEAICISTEAYHEYVTSTGLRDQMHMELYRKPFDEMRWEEIWDTALRIRNMFSKTPIPSGLQEKLRGPLARRFSERPVSVRSSAPGEDSSKTSFAGLHESFVNIRGLGSILENIKLVWASLWSDRALLYRQELGLDVEKSTMAVVVQEMVFGERSGVVFGMSPVHEKQSAVEAVYGLNQGLVDGTVEPDRWILNRDSGKILGQPAGPGIAVGKARVVLDSSDLFSFQKGEILVCDAVDPGMTFVVPLAAAIVERRGGMLIHGAIIAREYGIPCVTGVPDAVNQIKTGDFITVDGHLGIVIIGEATLTTS